MKVLFVNTNDTHGGAARAAMRIMRGVQLCGVETKMLVKYRMKKSDDIVCADQALHNSTIYNFIEWIKRKITNKIYANKWLRYQNTKKNNIFLSDLRGSVARDVWQKFDYDIVHLHWLNMRFVDVQHLANIHKPIVWTLHDSWPFTGICHLPFDCMSYVSHCGACPMLGSNKESDFAYEEFEKKIEAYKDLNLHIVTPSRWLGECAKRSALLGRYPVHVIPNCIDTELFTPFGKKEARQLLHLDQEKTYLLFGAMHATEDANKGFAYLQEALGHLSGANLELLVYGTTEDLQSYNLPIPVRVLGYIYEDKIMALLYNAADVCVVPSLSENLSNTIMESLSCGKPVVAFNIGGNSDMIDHMENGYLAKELDSEDLAKGIEWCISHNTDGSLSEKARQKVMDNFTIEIVSEQYKKLYESLL